MPGRAIRIRRRCRCDSVSRVTTFLTETSNNAINISFERNVRACALVLMDGNGNPSLLFVNGVKKSFTLLAGAQRNVTWNESGTSVAIGSVTWNSVTVLSTTTVEISVAYHSVSRGDANTEDFNKLVEPGCYIIGSLAQNAANCPSGAQSWGVLTVHAGQPGGYLVQMYSDSYGKFWVRSCWAGNWYPWVKIGS